MAYPEEYVHELSKRALIVPTVAKIVKLRKASGGRYVGLCPFHQEMTPSFFVLPHQNAFKCFGCGKGGAVIQFVMEYHGFEFPEALEFLWKRWNYPLWRWKKSQAEKRKRP